nr:hypothetical protein CFP56_63499 [Quercus suber]
MTFGEKSDNLVDDKPRNKRDSTNISASGRAVPVSLDDVCYAWKAMRVPWIRGIQVFSCGAWEKGCTELAVIVILMRDVGCEIKGEDQEEGAEAELSLLL